MALNVKSDEAHKLAQELARVTGESLTAAVTTALRERLARVRRGSQTSLAQQLLAIGKDAAPRFKEPYKSAEHGDLLYDERGLPK